MKQIKVGSDTVISRNVDLERYLKDIRKTKPLSAAEERVVIKKAKEGDEKARELIILSNVRFVVSVAKEYQYPGVELLDLISAGNIGMMNALEGYSLERETKFISYAVWHIKNGVIEYLRENIRLIRLPYNQQDDLNKYNKHKEKLERDCEANLNLEQVAEQLEGTEGAVNLPYLRQTLACSFSPASLSEALNKESEEGSLEDVIADPTANFLEKYNNDYNVIMVGEALQMLSPTQKKVISYSFGFVDNMVYSNEDIADKLSLTAERIRQIKNNALEKLKKAPHLYKCISQ